MRALALVALASAPGAVHAQSGPPAQNAFAPCRSGCLNLGVDHFGLGDGLPGMYIPDLAVTGDGLLWLNVSGLLVSFDGLEFETHDLAAFPDPDRTLRGIGAGRGDTLWVLVGRQLFSHAGEQVQSWSTDEEWLFNVWQGDDGVLRALRYDGAFRLGRQGFEREVGLTGNWHTGVLPEDHVEAIPEEYTRTPGLWLHLLDRGDLRRFHTRWVEDPLPFPDAWPIPDTTKRTVLVRTGGATTAVTRLDGTPVTRLPPEAGTWPLLVDRRGLTWTRRPGRVMAVDAAGTIVATLPLTADARVVSAAEDGEGNIWIGTVTHGLFRIRPLPVRVLGAAAGLTDSQVRRVYGGDRGSILVLDDRERVMRIGTAGVDTVFVPSGGRIATGAFTDRRGTVWVGVAAPGPRGLLEGRTVDGTALAVEVTVGSRFVEDPGRDRIWTIADRVFRLTHPATDSQVVDVFLEDDGLQLRDLLIDPEGVVWATGPQGLARISDAGVEEFRVDAGYTLAGGRSLHRTDDGTIWIGHYQAGIVRFRDGEFRAVRAADGLWDDGASTILEDDAGNFWMSSNRGVHRVARRELDAFLDGEITHVRGRGYGPDAGFRNAEASGWPGHRSPDGRLWFPTFSGVAVIDPTEVLASEQAPPRIRIRGVVSDSDEFAPDSVLALPLGQRRAGIAFGATLLSGHAGIRYGVRLDGVDPDWRDVGSQRQVTYGNLPPGRHVFRARAISGGGVAGAEEATITLVVPPFFHETAAFKVLVALLATGALWFAYHVRVRQLRAREATLERLVDERTHELAESKEQTEAALVTVEAQAKELRSLDEARSRFFANVSHELRTPLTLVQGPLQDVLDGRLGPTPEPVREQVATVLSSGRRLGELVEQLLDVARLEAGEMRLHVRRHDLRPLFDRLAHAFGALAQSRGITFAATVPDGAIHANVDADHMEKVWANLLANALKFTPTEGHVSFDVAIDDDALVVTVTDDGPGIPHAEQRRIFDRFHQVDGSARRVHGGTGLGLALVKEVAELHGGSVAVWSEPGTGSRFTVRVPCDGAADGDADAEATSSPEAPVQAHPPVSIDETTGTEPHTILVIEDNPDLRAYLRRHLEPPYHVVEAANGTEGLEEAGRAHPDLLLCDLMMPGMDGEELCRVIRADAELSYLPILIVTAKASRRSRLSALEAGADDYVVKPFDPEELRLRVANALASRRRFAERLRAAGRTVPFVPLELPDATRGRDFAATLDAVLRERMGDEDLAVDDLADALAMSRATLYRKTQEELGMTPMDVLWTFRLDQAAHWLRATDGTVSEIAYASGFKTVPHFTRRFRARFGATPAAYRRQGDRS